MDALAVIGAHWVLRTNICHIQLFKLTAKACMAQRISAINLIAAVCEASAPDVCEVARAIGTYR